MSTPPTATPRTDNAWCRYNCAELPDPLELVKEMNALETELTAAKECVAIANRSADDQMHQKREAQTELARLRAELAKIYSLVAPHGCDLPNGIWETARAVSDLIARAEIAENWSDHHASHADDLIAENVKLRAELKELSHVYELNKVSIDELHSEQARAERAEAEVERLLRYDAERQIACESYFARAEKAEAELAFQVARNSDLFTQRDEAVEAQEKAEVELKQMQSSALTWARFAGDKSACADLAEQRARLTERLWKEFITLMDITEESDSGNAFNPNKISSCRAMDGKRLNEILIEARQIVF